MRSVQRPRICRVRERRREMITRTLTRVLLAAVIAVAAIDTARAQCITNFCGPPFSPPGGSPTPGGPGPSHHRDGWYIVGAIVFAVAGWAIGNRLFSSDPPDPPSSSPPPGTTAALSQGPGPGSGGSRPASGSGGGAGAGGGGTVAPLRAGFNLPPAGETRFLPDSVLADAPLRSEEHTSELQSRFGI